MTKQKLTNKTYNKYMKKKKRKEKEKEHQVLVV
jgi:hypothetical protein